MRILRYSYRIFIGFLKYFYGFQLESCGISIGFLWDFYLDAYFFAVPMLFHVISAIFLWDFCGIPMRLPWYFYDLSMGLLWDVT